MPLRAQLQRSFHLGPVALLDLTATKLLTFGSRTSKARHHPLSDHRPLKLSEDTEHLEHGAARRGGRVEPLLMQEQIDALRMEVRQEAQQVRQ